MNLEDKISSHYRKFKINYMDNCIKLDIVSSDFNNMRMCERFDKVFVMLEIETLSKQLNTSITLSLLTEEEFLENGSEFYPFNIIKKELGNFEFIEKGRTITINSVVSYKKRQVIKNKIKDYNILFQLF